MTIQSLLDLDKLDKWEEAPMEGQVLAYITTEGPIYHTYKTLDDVIGLLKDKDLLELHLFNDEKEYRLITTSSKRFSNGVIEHVADFSEENAEENYKIFEEETKLEDGEKGTLIVLNKISFDKNGSAYMDDYRLKVGGNCNE